jgi:hypothetical protein
VDALSENQLRQLEDMDRNVWALMLDAHDRALTYLRTHSDDVLVAERHLS